MPLLRKCDLSLLRTGSGAMLLDSRLAIHEVDTFTVSDRLRIRGVVLLPFDQVHYTVANKVTSRSLRFLNIL